MQFPRFWSSQWWSEKVKPTAERLANKPRAEVFLFFLEIAASTLLPIPGSVVLLALITAAPHKWWRFALSSSAGVSTAALILYFVGRLFFDSVGVKLLAFYDLQSKWEDVATQFSGYAGVSLVLLAGLTTGITRFVCLGAGFAGMNPVLFLILLSASRGSRVFAQSALIKYLREKFQTFPKRYFRYATLALCLVFLVAMILFSIMK